MLKLLNKSLGTGQDVHGEIVDGMGKPHAS